MQFFAQILSVIGFCFLRSLPPAVLVVATAIINPLNVVSATDRASQDIFFRYIAPLYGNSLRGEESQPITVIMLDDHFVETVGSGWPVSHRTMTRFLQTLYCYAPKSIFFDLLFTHEHSKAKQTEQFISYLKPDETLQENIVGRCAKYFVDRDRDKADQAKELERLQDKLLDADSGILPLPPAFIGDLAPQKDYPVEGGTAVFDQLVDPGIRRLPTNWVSDDGAYPLVITLDEEATVGAANAAETWQTVWPGHTDGKVPSTALALYATLDGAKGRATLDDEDGLAALVAEQQKKLIVEWGFYPRHLPDEAMTEAELESDKKAEKAGQLGEFLRLRQFPKSCHPRPDDFTLSFLDGWPRLQTSVQSLAPLKESVWQFLLDTVGVLNTNPDQPRQTCPYNQWVPGEAVLFANSPAQKDTLRALFEDRVVMIGADIKGAPDLVQSPVHGQIPGVFLHAMALDNLMERGLEGYWRPMPTLPKRDYVPAVVSEMSIGTSIELVLLWTLLAFSKFIGYLRKGLGERWSEAAYTGVELLGHVALVFGTVAALAAYAIAPMNWIGLATLAVSKDILQRFQIPKIESSGIMRLRSKLTP